MSEACGRPADHDEANPLTHYCIIRRDLPIGLIAANIGHAAGETGPAPNHCHMVILMTPDEPGLRRISEKLAAKGIWHHPVIECDGDHGGQMMAIGFRPALRNTLKRHLSQIPLLK